MTLYIAWLSEGYTLFYYGSLIVIMDDSGIFRTCRQNIPEAELINRIVWEKL